VNPRCAAPGAAPALHEPSWARDAAARTCLGNPLNQTPEEKRECQNQRRRAGLLPLRCWLSQALPFSGCSPPAAPHGRGFPGRAGTDPMAQTQNASAARAPRLALRELAASPGQQTPAESLCHHGGDARAGFCYSNTAPGCGGFPPLTSTAFNY